MISAPPKTVKGTLVLARLRYLRSKGGAAEERVMGRLSSQDRSLLRGMVLPSAWYSLDVLHRLDGAIAAELSQGRRAESYLDMGRFSATANLSAAGVHRPYMRDGDPHFLLGHLAVIYSTVHSGGQRTYEKTSETSGIVRTLDAEEISGDECLTTIGWLERAIELSGGRHVTVTESRCRARGAPLCEYRCAWETPVTSLARP